MVLLYLRKEFAKVKWCVLEIYNELLFQGPRPACVLSPRLVPEIERGRTCVRYIHSWNVVRERLNPFPHTPENTEGTR